MSSALFGGPLTLDTRGPGQLPLLLPPVSGTANTCRKLYIRTIFYIPHKPYLYIFGASFTLMCIAPVHGLLVCLNRPLDHKMSRFKHFVKIECPHALQFSWKQRWRVIFKTSNICCATPCDRGKTDSFQWDLSYVCRISLSYVLCVFACLKKYTFICLCCERVGRPNCAYVYHNLPKYGFKGF